MAKRTATMKNIDSINNNLKQIASIFGVGSRQWEAATADIFRFQVYTNKNGILQIKNNKANRQQHQTIRARKKQNLNIRKAKQEALARMNKYNKDKRSKQKFTSLKAFEQRMKDLEDKAAEIYEVESAAQELGLDYDAYQAFKDPDYLANKAAEVRAMQLNEEAYANDGAERANFTVAYDEEGNTIVVNEDTGEVVYEYGKE